MDLTNKFDFKLEYTKNLNPSITLSLMSIGMIVCCYVDGKNRDKTFKN